MNKRIPFILGFILLAIAIWLQMTSIHVVAHVINRLENIAYDMQLRANLLTQPKKWQTSVAIVDIDDRSLESEGRWPWPRLKIAQLVENIRAAGAVVIAFDIIFPEKQNNIAEEIYHALKQENLQFDIDPLFKKISPNFDHDAKLSAIISSTDSILGISFLPTTQTEGLLPLPAFVLKTIDEKQLGIIVAPGYLANIPILQNAAKGAGFINIFPDEDGIIRHAPVLIRYQDNLYPSLAIEAVRLYLLSKIKLITANYNGELEIEGLQIGDHQIPTNSDASVIVPFRGNSFLFPYYSATDIIHNKIPAGALEGKIIFIGTSATGEGDLKATAIQNIFPGVEIQATIADGILTDNFSYKPAWALGAEIFQTVFLGLIFIFLFPYLGPRSLSIIIIFIPASLVTANALLWERTGLIISVFIPILLCITLALLNMFYGYLFESRKREKLKEIFGQYVPEKHIDEMLTSSSEFSLHGENRELTVLFADIRNFTALSEPLTAAQLKEMLNEFFTPMTEIIFKFRGTIDKYIGDMIMAFWGAPLKDKHHARHAIRTALLMQQTVEKLKIDFAKKGWAEIDIGIGINTGSMNVGDMGSKFRRNYTVLGDAVNLASRVESLTKYYGSKIIVTENTEANQPLFLFRKLDRVKVKGKTRGVEIFEPMGYVKDFPVELKKEIDMYHSALEYYFNREWEKAQALFTELSREKPDEKLYQLYLKRLADFAINPPPEDWGGIYTHLEK
ncbi:MAG TPA: adenylate/guanylate cyclase domain-containing protein [Gammaproteobacteria bacterium]|nr:adenylate/guanylate cyclase domain-containing protein [Gammaproteobacteria bacterium]